MQRATPDEPARGHPERDAALRVLRTLRQRGYVAYLAGGCVRDRLLGFDPKDYDVATDAHPGRVMELFPNSRAVGEAFGVILVRCLGHTVEVATFRKDWGYTDGRRPSRVDYTDAEHDARRRDFTINGLFEDPLAEADDQRVIDYVGGVRDLRAGLVRTVGDPHERFAEDYLRMLRAVRFASRLGFQLDPDTAAAVTAHHERLDQISRERIGQELEWMLTPADRARTPRAAADALRLIEALHLDAPVLREPHRDRGLPVTEALHTAAATPGAPTPDFPTALAAWMLDRHPPDADAQLATDPQPAADPSQLADAMTEFANKRLRDLVRHWRAALCLSNDHRDQLLATLAPLPRALRWPTLRLAQRKRLLAEARWPQARLLLGALAGRCAAVADAAASLDRDAADLLDQGVAPGPWVNGDDLIALGLKPGPTFRRLIELVYDAQLEHAVRDRREALDWVRRLAEQGLGDDTPG